MSDDIRNAQFLSKNDICRPANSGEMTVQSVGVKRPLPCIVILVHGVNDVGEAYENQDTGICAGLNDRLNRKDLQHHEWKSHEFMISDEDGNITSTTCKVMDQTCVGVVNRSPVIPFYWGYKPVDHAEFEADQKRYREELRKKGNDADLAYDAYQQDDPKIIQAHNKSNIDNLNNWLDPASAKGGGTFANATTNIPDMFGPGGAGKILAIIGKLMSRTEAFNLNGKDWSHPIYQNPHRIYQAYAARRLADLILAIRRNDSTRNDTINVVAHSQGTIITMLANMWVNAEDVHPADCVVLNHSPYALENRALEDTLPGNQQSTKGREETFGNFCRMMAKNSQYQPGNGPHSGDDIQKLTDSGCLSRQAQWCDARFSRNNFGMVWNYFCANDQVVSMSPIQGFGWRGVPDKVHALSGENLRQRAFCKDYWIGDKTDFHFVMPPRQPDDPKDTKYSYSDVTVSGAVLPHPFQFKLMAQGKDDYKALLSGNDPKIAKAAMKAERLIPETIDVPNEPLFYTLQPGQTLNDIQLQKLSSLNPENNWELVSGSTTGTKGSLMKISVRRRMTDAELEKAVQMSTAYSQHSSIVASIETSRYSTAYDLAIGQCEAFEDKAFWDQLLLQADWRRGDLNPVEAVRNYFKSGILPEAFKKLMNKPESGKQQMPSGDFGVVNDYGSRTQHTQTGLRDIYGRMETQESAVLQWDMPKPQV